MQNIKLKGFNNLELNCYIFEPTIKPKAVVQIIHGMQEHALRYKNFSEFLAKNGFIVFDEKIEKIRDYEEEIKFKKSDKDAYFIRTSTKYFYEKVKEKLKKLQPERCIECGLCSYICPAKINLKKVIKKPPIRNDGGKN